MKFDGYSCSVSASHTDIIRAMVHHFDAEVLQRRPSQGYDRSMLLVPAGRNPVAVSWGGIHRRPHCSVMGEVSGEVVQLLRGQFPRHSVSRVDVCEDYTAEGAWEVLSGIVIGLVDEMGLNVEHRGDWHRGIRGRTLYVGSRSSVLQVCLYEKGKKEDADPNWVRLEFRVRPKSRDKARMAALEPHAVASFVRWGFVLQQRVEPMVPDRNIKPLPPSVKELPERVEWLCRQYGKTILDLLAECGGDLEELGRRLVYGYHESREADESVGGSDRQYH